MTNKQVIFYLLFCLLQLPFYWNHGRPRLGFDDSATKGEALLYEPPSQAQEAALEKSLERTETLLEQLGTYDSRWARPEFTRALAEWAKENREKADNHFRKTIYIYAHSHGPDSFYANVVRLKYAEFLMHHQDYTLALPMFTSSLGPVTDFLGPEHPLVVRMTFRRVALLTFLGRKEEAADLARTHLQGLTKSLAEVDPAFIAQTGLVMDTLSDEGLLSRPPDLPSWKEKLDELYQQRLDRGSRADAMNTFWNG